MKVRKSPEIGFTEGAERIGFNGTAPVKVRKCGGGTPAPTPSKSLQWDRTREGAEVRRHCREGRREQLLQWDRTREGAEVCRSGRNRESLSPSFNGTAPVKVRKSTALMLTGLLPRCFNGTAPVKVRKWDGRKAKGRFHPRFNGTAPVKVRK